MSTFFKKCINRIDLGLWLARTAAHQIFFFKFKKQALPSFKLIKLLKHFATETDIVCNSNKISSFAIGYGTAALCCCWQQNLSYG